MFTILVRGGYGRLGVTICSMRKGTHSGISFMTKIFYVNFCGPILRCSTHANTHLVLLSICPSLQFYSTHRLVAWRMSDDWCTVQKLISLCIVASSSMAFPPIKGGLVLPSFLNLVGKATYTECYTTWFANHSIQFKNPQQKGLLTSDYIAVVEANFSIRRLPQYILFGL